MIKTAQLFLLFHDRYIFHHHWLLIYFSILQIYFIYIKRRIQFLGEGIKIYFFYFKFIYFTIWRNFFFFEYELPGLILHWHPLLTSCITRSTSGSFSGRIALGSTDVTFSCAGSIGLIWGRVEIRLDRFLGSALTSLVSWIAVVWSQKGIVSFAEKK